MNAHPRPWRLAPLEGKYYETEIVDADGQHVLYLNVGGDDLSPREGDQDPEWIDWSHSEKGQTYELAMFIINAVNE